MALFDFLKPPKTSPKRRARRKTEPQTPKEAQQLAQARLTTEIYSGKRKIEGIDMSRIGMASILRDVAPDGNVGEFLATIEILQDSEKSKRFADAYLQQIEEGRPIGRRGKKGKDEDEPMSEFERYLHMQDMMDEIEDRREERRRGHRSGEAPPIGGFERVLDNLTRPDGVLAKAVEAGLPIGPMLAAATQQRAIQQPRTVEPQTQIPASNFQQAEISASLDIGDTGDIGEGIPVYSNPNPNLNGGDMYRSLVLRLVNLFDTSLAPAEAAENAWQILSQEMVSAGLLQRIALGSAIGAILSSPASTVIEMMQAYKTDPEIGPTISNIEANLPWLEEFLQQLQQIWSQASEETEAQQAESRR